jgi:cytochrome c-type biogenesis protein CcmH/NrfG
MENQQTTALAAETVLEPKRVYTLALLCLVVGLGIGYVLHVAEPATPTLAPTAKAPMPASPHGTAANGHMPTVKEMKQMADKKAAPLKEKLKSDPKNAELLAQVGAIYHSAQQFEDAIGYYSQSVQADPKNPALRIKLAASLFRSGDADGAIAQLNDCLKIDPSNANALFDLGMIKLQGKQDAKGAAVAWRHLLKSNPDLSPEHKAAVEKMLAQASANEPRKGSENHDGTK